MASLIPGSLETQTREPLDGKYIVNNSDVTTLNSGLTFNGLQRFNKIDDKLWIKLSTGWKEILTSSNSSSFALTIGSVTKGDIASVTNTGTGTNPILNFVLPKGDKGGTPIIDIGTVEGGTTASVTNVGTIDRAILNFVIPQGISGNNGSSVWVAYAQNSAGLGATFTYTNTTKYVAFYSSVLQPALTDFTNWQKFIGDNGTPGGPAGLSAYEIYVNNGHPNATIQNFLDSLRGNDGAAGTTYNYTPENVANKGVNNGYASLDSTGKVPTSQLPAAGPSGPTNTDGLTEGTTNLYFTGARTIAALLTGYVKATTNRALAITDSIKVAFGVLEKRIDDNSVSITSNTTSITANTNSIKKFETIISFPAGSTVSPPDFYPTTVTLSPITKAASINTVEYSVNGGTSYTSIIFTSGVSNTNITINALTEVIWRITTNSGYNTGSISVIATKP